MAQRRLVGREVQQDVTRYWSGRSAAVEKESPGKPPVYCGTCLEMVVQEMGRISLLEHHFAGLQALHPVDPAVMQSPA